MKSYVSSHPKIQKKRACMCFGTFDILHPGHRHYIDTASTYGELYIVVARDTRVYSRKWKHPVHSETTRVHTLENAYKNAHILLWHPTDIYAHIRTVQPDILCIWYDQYVPTDIHTAFPDIEIVHIAAYREDVYKSSIIKKAGTKK